MLRTLTLHSLLTWLPLLLSLSSLGEGRPRLAHRGAPDAGREESQRGLILEAVKKGILSSMGMETAPRPAEKASEQDLRRMYRLYREKLRELRGNSSQPMRESGHSLKRMSTVLFPATVEPVKRLGSEAGHLKSDPYIQWYRAVFHRNPNIRTELTLVRAQLKIYRQLLDEPRPEQTESRQEVQVKVYATKTLNSSAQTHLQTLSQTSVPYSKDLDLDIRAEVERWRRLDAGQSLVVDVGLVAGQDGEPKVNPQVSIEIGLTEPRRDGRGRRHRRSNREDNCDEQGRCCRKSVSVSFKEIGWSDWVVAPTAYTMHFCDGTCPHNYKPASMHTQVKSRMHQMTKGATPRPCCVPAAYEPMILMHYDSRGKVKLTPFNDLIVSKCLCT